MGRRTLNHDRCLNIQNAALKSMTGDPAAFIEERIDPKSQVRKPLLFAIYNEKKEKGFGFQTRTIEVFPAFCPFCGKPYEEEG